MKNKLIWVDIFVELSLLFILAVPVVYTGHPDSSIRIVDDNGIGLVSDSIARLASFAVFTPMFLFVSCCFFCDINEL